MTWCSCGGGSDASSISNPVEVIKQTLDLLEKDKYSYIKDQYFNGSDQYFFLELNNVTLMPLKRKIVLVYENRLELVQMILQSVMDKRKILMQKDVYGNGPIHLAVIANSPEIVAVLLKEGMNKDLENNLSETPMDLARLLERGSEITDLLEGNATKAPKVQIEEAYEEEIKAEVPKDPHKEAKVYSTKIKYLDDTQKIPSDSKKHLSPKPSVMGTSSDLEKIDNFAETNAFYPSSESIQKKDKVSGGNLFLESRKLKQ